jgi:ABC-type multidrug transport system ATPase subunit
MKLKELLIQDFRGIEKLSIDFCAGEPEPQRLAVFAGPNGAGKTSILEAILLTLGRPELLKQRLTSHYRQARFGTKDFLLRARFNADSDETPSGMATDLRLRTGLLDVPVEKNDVVVSLPGGAARHLAQYKYEMKTNPYRNVDDEPIENDADVDYYSAWREARLVGPLGPSSGRTPRDTLEDEQARIELIKQSAINAALHEKFGQGDEIGGVFLDKWNYWWNRFHDIQRGHFEVMPISRNPVDGFDFFLKRDDGVQVPLDSLSSGEIEMLKFFRLINREQAGIIVLIDEPEQHLHPKWHRLILPMILDLAPKAQVICATHSPQIIGSTPPHQLWLTYWDQGRIAIAHPDHSFGMDANRVLEELLDVAVRPEEVRDQIRNLFDLIETRKLEGAKQQLASLRARLGDDPELVRADALIRRKEAIGR